jgi:drug/metabolite transporter (DMT)-like permease
VPTFLEGVAPQLFRPPTEISRLLVSVVVVLVAAVVAAVAAVAAAIAVSEAVDPLDPVVILVLLILLVALLPLLAFLAAVDLSDELACGWLEVDPSTLNCSMLELCWDPVGST